MHRQANISVHSKRYRLTDTDGACFKYVLDALVDAGVFQNDTPEYIKEITHSQEKVSRAKGEMEETIITISI